MMVLIQHFQGLYMSDWSLWFFLVAGLDFLLLSGYFFYKS